MKTYKLLLTVGLSLACMVLAATAQTNQSDRVETKSERDARMAWWREARFGMFIHWGVYSVPGHAEWYMSQGHFPKAEYEKFTRQFNPTNFDAAAWVRTAKDAGMKYLVITAKHHDGFSMFNTKAGGYNVVDDTPWQHDPLKDLAEECHRQGVRFCVYYSIMDWHHPDQLAADPDPEHPTYNPTTLIPGKEDDYAQYMKTQLKELITQYQPGLIWFDGAVTKGWTVSSGRDLYHYLHSLDPAIICNNRIKGAGDYDTPEQYIPAKNLGKDWETCMTINGSWGFNLKDDRYKTTETLIRNLCDIVSKGGNFLLNVGPDGMGEIPQPQLERLAEVGTWMKVNGEAIYGSGPTPFSELHGKYNDRKKDKLGNPELIPVWDWRCSTKPGKIYVMIFQWPTNGKFELPGLQSKVNKAYLLADHKELKVNQTEAGVNLLLPAAALDKIASVVCLEIADAVAKVAVQK